MARLSKNSKGYGYNYLDLAGIHEFLEENKLQYRQSIEVIDGTDYINTVIIHEDGTEEPPVRGCRIMLQGLQDTKNPAQAYGAGITYARRYSLLMALGLCTEDDDAAACEKKKAAKKISPAEARAKIEELCKASSSKVTMLNMFKQQIGCSDKKLSECTDDEVIKLYDLMK